MVRVLSTQSIIIISKFPPFLQKVVPGMLILGAVLEIHEYVVMFSLPFNMRGTLAISDVSDHVTQMVESEAQRLDSSQENDEVNAAFSIIYHRITQGEHFWGLNQPILFLCCRILEYR